MSFLGGFLLGQVVTFSVTWAPATGQPPIVGSSVTLRHPDGSVIGPVPGVAGIANVFSASVEPTKKGQWRVSWETTPDGGVTSDMIYVS